MIIAPTSGSIGMQLHGSQIRMINKSAATLAIGQAVTNSYAHTGFVYPATTVAESNLTPFACCTIALGATATAKGGYIGVVIDLQTGAGAVGTEVLVQFGGIVKAKVTSGTTATAFGTPLTVHNTNGGLDNGVAADATTGCAIALEALASGTANINVMLTNAIWFPVVI